MDRIIVVLNIPKKNIQVDLDIPTDISANDLATALSEAYKLRADTEENAQFTMKTENPISLLKGNKTLKEFMLRHGTIINIT